MAEPEITDAELDVWERRWAENEAIDPHIRHLILRLIKALRACRLQCEAHRRCTRDAMATADRMEEQSTATATALERIAAIAGDYNEVEGERMSAADVKDVLQTALRGEAGGDG